MRATSNADERGHVSIEINCAPKIERTERTLQQYARATHQASLKQDFQLYETCISSYKLFLLGQDAESVSARVFGMKTLQEGTQLIQRMRQRLEGGNIKLRATLGNNFERGTVSKVQILQKHDKFMQSMKNFVDRIGSTAAVQRRLQALKQSLVEASTASHQTGRSNTDGATKRYLSMVYQLLFASTVSIERIARRFKRRQDKDILQPVANRHQKMHVPSSRSTLVLLKNLAFRSPVLHGRHILIRLSWKTW
jgi:hypothetical protein